MSIWDEEGNSIRISKNDKGDEIIIKRVKRGQAKYTDVRTWYADKDGSLKPGKGIAIPDDLADEVAQAIMEVEDID